MENSKSPKILGADRLDGSVVITFDDGTSAVFSSSFLYANLAHARIVTESEDDDTD